LSALEQLADALHELLGAERLPEQVASRAPHGPALHRLVRVARHEEDRIAERYPEVPGITMSLTTTSGRVSAMS